jgi:DNA-binding NtrC family response regulator
MADESSPPNLLIVDDDESIRRLLVIAAKDHGWKPVEAGAGPEAFAALDDGIEAVVLDHGLPGMNGLQVLARIREDFPSLPVVMLTALNDAETAVQAIRAGARDYVTKPFELKRLFDLLQQAKRTAREDPGVAGLRAPHKSRSEGVLKSSSKKIRELFRHMEKAAQLDSTILLTGESGTGKTCFAREIHRMSRRGNEVFITVSCPALPKQLLESELFGHERGAFTGATSTRAGRFEQASKGTLLLDEIGDLAPELQPKLLNVLQDREYFSVGGSKVLRTNARVIAATNVDLLSKVEEGKFREDLYYRLNIIELRVPSLRERKEDLPDLAASILSRIASNRGTRGWTITEDAAKTLQEYSWPGNIRQLENVLERATTFTERAELGAEDFMVLLEDPREKPAAKGSKRTLQELEKDAFVEAFARNGNSKTKTARDLGVSVRTVYNYLDRYGLK